MSIFILTFVLVGGHVSAVEFIGDAPLCKQAGESEVAANRALSYTCSFKGVYDPLAIVNTQVKK